LTLPIKGDMNGFVTLTNHNTKPTRNERNANIMLLLHMEKTMNFVWLDFIKLLTSTPYYGCKCVDRNWHRGTWNFHGL